MIPLMSLATEGLLARKGMGMVEKGAVRMALAAHEKKAKANTVEVVARVMNRVEVRPSHRIDSTTPVPANENSVEDKGVERVERSSPALIRAIVKSLRNIEGYMETIGERVARLISSPAPSALLSSDQKEDDGPEGEKKSSGGLKRLLISMGIGLLLANLPALLSWAKQTLGPLLSTLRSWMVDDFMPFITKTLPDFFGNKLPNFFSKELPAAFSGAIGKARQGMEKIEGVFKDSILDLKKGTASLLSTVAENLKKSSIPAMRALGVEVEKMASSLLKDVEASQETAAAPVASTPSVPATPTTSSAEVKGSDIRKVATVRSGADVENLNPVVKERLFSMASAHKEKTGKKIAVNSGYRSRAKQDSLYRKWISGGRKGPAPAKPGRSRHESGMAVDIDSKDANELSSSGLLRSSGFHRPLLGIGERWHLEPSDVPPSGSGEDGGTGGSSTPPTVASSPSLSIGGGESSGASQRGLSINPVALTQTGSGPGLGVAPTLSGGPRSSPLTVPTPPPSTPSTLGPPVSSGVVIHTSPTETIAFRRSGVGVNSVPEVDSGFGDMSKMVFFR